LSLYERLQLGFQEQLDVHHRSLRTFVVEQLTKMQDGIIDSHTKLIDAMTSILENQKREREERRSAGPGLIFAALEGVDAPGESETQCQVSSSSQRRSASLVTREEWEGMIDEVHRIRKRVETIPDYMNLFQPSTLNDFDAGVILNGSDGPGLCTDGDRDVDSEPAHGASSGICLEQGSYKVTTDATSTGSRSSVPPEQMTALKPLQYRLINTPVHGAPQGTSPFRGKGF
jgi:hypothetical protein